MQRILNHFVGGVDTDTSPLKRSNDTLIDALNLRLTDVASNVMVLTSIDGTQQSFQLTQGFAPLGHAIYGGVAYIFSYNSVTGEGEVGSYPSPNLNCNGGFQPIYRPLRNWNGAVDPRVSINRQDFRTTLLKLQCPNQLEVQARVSWDGSVELFFTDNVNPFRHINTGFHAETGICNDRLLWTGSFPNRVSVFFESCGHPILTSLQLEPGGQLQAGNWFFYPRYVTADLNKTSFMNEIGPAQISRDVYSAGVTLDGNAGLDNTNKSVRINVDNIDSSFAFVEFGFVYFHDDTFEVRVIDKLFPITPGSTTLSALITGTETIVDLTLAELLRKKTTDDVVRSIDQLDNTLWGGGWKSSLLPDALMNALAQQIVAKPADPASMPYLIDRQPFGEQTANEAFEYKDYQNTLSQVGYFRGESYAFAIVFVFKNGKRSKPFPVTGYDAWGDAGITQPNTKGVLRMPSNMNPGYAYYQRFANNDWRPRPLGVRFDTTGISLPQWAQDDVCGFYFVRAERKPNLVYQGLVANAYKGEDLVYTTSFPDSDQSTLGQGLTWTQQFESARLISELSFRSEHPDGRMAVPYEYNPGVGSPVLVGSTYIPRTASKFGIFSSDHFFTRSLLDGQYHIVHQGYAGNTGADPDGLPRMFERHMTSGSRTPDLYWDQVRFTPRNDLLLGSGFLTNVAERSYTETNGFCSGYEFGDDTTIGLPVMFYHTSGSAEMANRRIGQRNYIGLSFTENGSTPIPVADNQADSPLGPSIVNVYRNDPRTPLQGGTYDPASIYNPNQEQYYDISAFIPISEWANLPTTIIYRGDCFIQRTYHRHISEMGYHGPDQTAILATNGDAAYYNYGNLVGCIQECAINTAMRYETGQSDNDQRYYPEKLPYDPAQFAAVNTQHDESRFINNGYQRMLGLYADFGFDIQLPAVLSFWPNRIKWSNPYVNERISDGYLSWDLDAYKDFDHRYGPIVRIMAQGGRLYSIMENAVFLHSTSERALLQNATEGQLLLGSGDKLSPSVGQLTTQFGSQHQWSIIKTLYGIYGYDQRNRMFWRVAGNSVEMLSTEKRFATETYSLSEMLTPRSDILSRYPDAPVCDEGITAFWDRKFSEVGWSFLIQTLPNTRPEGRTVVFNERVNVFGGKRSYASNYYILIGEDLHSVDPGGTPAVVPGASVDCQFYLHDALSNAVSTFYGDQYQSYFDLIVRPGPSVFAFNAIHMKGTPVPLLKVLFSNELGASFIDPFVGAPHWEEPEYQENAWRMPVPPYKSVTPGSDYDIESPVKGGYLRVRGIWETNLRHQLHETYTLDLLSYT